MSFALSSLACVEIGQCSASSFGSLYVGFGEHAQCVVVMLLQLLLPFGLLFLGIAQGCKMDLLHPV